MKKRIFFLLILIALFLIPGFAQNEPSYSIGFYPHNYMPCPGDKISVDLSLYYYNLQRQGDFSEKVTVNIYKIPADSSNLNYEEFIKENEPVETLEKNIKLETYGGDYWNGYNTIELPPLTSGNYYAVCSTDKCTSESYFRVSNLGLCTKITEDELIIFAQNRKTGKALKNTEINLTLNEKSQKLQTDSNGIARIYFQDTDAKSGDYYTIIAVSGEDSAEISVSVPSDQEIFKGYIYTDRPVYRPEQDVKFKAILRTEKNSALSFASDKEIKVVINDTQGTEVYKETLKTDEFGTISGGFTLEEEPPLGVYYIYCTDPDGQQATGSFKVEEYRKPEFEITLTPEKEKYIQGDNMTFNVDVNYYFGAPVPDTEFTYEIYRDYYYPRYWSYWWEEDVIPYYYDYYGGGGEFIKSEAGVTDKKGHASFSCEAAKLDYDANYRVLVRMTDESRREVTGGTTILITKGAFYLTVTPDKYYYEPGEKAHLKVEAKDYSGHPVQTDLDLKIRYERYDKEKSSWDWENEETVTLKTDKDGLLYYDCTINEDGYYEIICNSKDQNGNEISTSGYLYCYSGTGYYNWYNRFSNVEIIPDKNIYEPGEEASFFIVCPFEGVEGLVTVEGEKIFSEEIMDFSNRTGSLKVKVTPELSPNFYVTVTFFHEGSFYHQSKKIICPAKDKFLTVSITSDKEKYKPRDTAKFTIKTLDYENKPVTSQVTMGIADESVYAVAGESTPNIQKFFYGMKQNKTVTCGSDGSVYGGQNYYHGGLYDARTVGIEDGFYMEADEAMPSVSMEMSQEVSKMDMNGGGDSFNQPEFTREYFPDTAYFNPSIITDENGIAEVMVSMPDSLTTWRATARGVTEDTKVGENTEEVIVTKDLLARLITTRFYTERDEALITGIFHNYLNSEKEVLVKLKIDGGIEILDSESYKITVPPNGEVPLDWRVKVKKAGNAVIKLTALTDEESDAVELTVPVLPHGTEKYVAFAGSTKDEVEEEITLPIDAEQGSAKLLILLEPSLASTVLTSLEYLIGYPYGCVEQTMSRFLPTVIVAKTLGELDIHDEEMNKELPKMVKKGFERLYNYHHSDGGWGWWENDESHPYMTAYVIYGLALSKEAGYSVDENKINAGISWLRQNYSNQEDLNTRAYMAFAVTTGGENCKDWLKALYEKRQELNCYSLGVLAISLEKSGMDKEAEEIVKILEESADVTGTMASWTGRAHEHGWTDNEVETTAYCLTALLSINPDSPIIPKVIRFLALNRNGNCWYSTKDTAAAVMSLTGYLKISKELNPDFTADVTLNGTKIKSVKFTKEDVGTAGEKIEVPFGQGLLDGKNTVKLEMAGKGVLYYSVYLKYYTKEENIKSADSGFKIERTYYLLNPEAKDEKEREIELGSSGEIEVNCQDIILVKLKITGSRDFEYLIVEDPKPAGCEYDTEQRGNYIDWNYWYSHREERDEKIAYFSTYYWKGTREMTYRLRAETPGIFHVMPGRAYLMYSDEVGGNSDEIILTIKEGERDKSSVNPVPVPSEEIEDMQQEVTENQDNKSEPAPKKSDPLYKNLIGLAVMVLLASVFAFFIFSKKK